MPGWFPEEAHPVISATVAMPISAEPNSRFRVLARISFPQGETSATADRQHCGSGADRTGQTLSDAALAVSADAGTGLREPQPAHSVVNTTLGTTAARSDGLAALIG